MHGEVGHVFASAPFMQLCTSVASSDLLDFEDTKEERMRYERGGARDWPWRGGLDR